MDNIGNFINALDGMSLVIGLGIGLAFGLIFALLNRASMRRTSARMSAEMKMAFGNLSAEALRNNQESLVALANERLNLQTHQHVQELEAKKALIDQQLAHISAALNHVPIHLQQSTAELAESNKSFLEFMTEKADVQTKQHIAELEAKKKLIDQQLEQMSAALEKVPTKLEKNQYLVAQELQKSTERLKESNQGFLSQLSEKSEAQTEKHSERLDQKEGKINERLTEMDRKLGEVQDLISEFEKARESKLGALDDQLKQLTQTTSSLQQALADNRARGQWGERMAEDMLNFMGLVEGVNYIRQATIKAGTRPDFTFLLPNQKSLNMDAKFPLTNYLRYFEAENEAQRREFSSRFLSDVKQRVSEIRKRDYIDSSTVDCVLIFIPNEQIYRFIHEQDNSIIDSALEQKVILCSPLTLYAVLAVIRQAAQNFNIEQRSREVVRMIRDIRDEWKKYTSEMDKLERSFSTMHNRFKDLNGVRTRKLGSAFEKVDAVIESSELHSGDERPLLIRKD